MVSMSMLRIALAAIALAAVLLQGRPAGATSPAAEPIAIAVFDLDYVDSSGEVQDQQKEHAARLQRFAEGLRQDLAGSGKYRIVYPACQLRFLYRRRQRSVGAGRQRPAGRRRAGDLRRGA